MELAGQKVHFIPNSAKKLLLLTIYLLIIIGFLEIQRASGKADSKSKISAQDTV